MTRYRSRSIQPLVCSALAWLAWANATAQERNGLPALNLDAPTTLDGVIQQLAAKRVVFVGETHDRYDHHLNQLEIIRRLHQIEPKLAIGVEYLEQRFQPQVDDYIAGKSTEAEFLKGVQYFQSWGYDYRLYAPIFRFAREQHIPLQALNVPPSLPSAVAKFGLAGLTKEQRAALPQEIAPADNAYKARLQAAFETHAGAKRDAFDHFIEAQLVWDESMAANAAAFLNANPGVPIVILAGAGHIAFGSGIPSRLERRTHASYAIVLSSGEDVEPRIADYILLSSRQELPPAGILGTSLKDQNGQCRVESVSPGSAADKAGIERGDILLGIDGQPVRSVADVRLALWDKKPGEQVRISVRHKRQPERDIEVVLGAAHPSA
jgi:uncharacterized iron-regulated protein